MPQVGRDGLLAALAEADVVVCTLPSTDETRGLVGEREQFCSEPIAAMLGQHS